MERHDYIVAVDYCGRYLVVERTTSLTFNTVPQKFKVTFARFRTPQTLMSVKGSSYRFKDSALAWNFEHVTCSPLYPQSKWFSKTAKIHMEKAHDSMAGPCLHLWEYRIDLLKWSAQLSMSRHLHLQHSSQPEGRLSDEAKMIPSKDCRSTTCPASRSHSLFPTATWKNGSCNSCKVSRRPEIIQNPHRRRSGVETQQVLHSNDWRWWRNTSSWPWFSASLWPTAGPWVNQAPSKPCWFPPGNYFIPWSQELY